MKDGDGTADRTAPDRIHCALHMMGRRMCQRGGVSTCVPTPHSTELRCWNSHRTNALMINDKTFRSHQTMAPAAFSWVKRGEKLEFAISSDRLMRVTQVGSRWNRTLRLLSKKTKQQNQKKYILQFYSFICKETYFSSCSAPPQPRLNKGLPEGYQDRLLQCLAQGHVNRRAAHHQSRSSPSTAPQYM